jgi:hypothetical protein
MRLTASRILALFSQRAPFGSLAPALAATFLTSLAAQAADSPKVDAAPPPSAPSPAPAPLGVFGADMPAPGRLVFSIVPSFGRFSGQRIGTQIVSNAYIVTNTPWFWTTSKLRLVPQNRFDSVQSVSLAYGVMKDVAIVVNTGMIEKNLDMLTFKGASGVIPLGMSYTGTDGMTDTQVAAVARVYEDPIHRLQVNLGFSFPTGSNHNTFTLLQPTGIYATSRAFYAMQPGTGTFDFLPGAVFAGAWNNWSWGVSYRGRIPLAANPEGYLYGDLHVLSGWGGYTWTPGITTTFRISGSTQGQIRGFDPLIIGKAPAANPNYYGGQRVETFAGMTLNGGFIGYDFVTLAIEAGLPVYQNLNGPQLSKNWQAGAALRFKI